MNAGGLWFLYIIWKFTSRIHGYCVCFSQPFWMNPRGIGITTPTLAEITSPQNALNSSWGKTVICPGHSNLSKRCGLCVMDKKNFIHPSHILWLKRCQDHDEEELKHNDALLTAIEVVSVCENTDDRMSFWGVQRHTVSYFPGIYCSESILQYHFLSLISIFLWISLFFWKIDFVLVETVFFVNSHATPLWSNTTHCSGVPGLRQYRFWWDLHPCADIVWISCWKLGSLVRKGVITYL